MKFFRKSETLQKFINDFWGVFSLFYIILCAFIALFAYIIAPDNSQNANTMHLSIHSQKPLFSVIMLSIPSSYSYSWKDYLQGSKQMIKEIPISDYHLTEKGISYSLYQSDTKYKENFFIDYDVFSENDPKEIEAKYIKKKIFWLGTDKYGRDLLSRIIIGTRISFVIGFVAVFISLFIGVVVGALSGYYQGFLDKVILWIINIVWSIPTLLLVIAFTLVLGKGYWQVFVAVGFTMWVEIARIVRGQVLSIKQMQYIEATRVLGLSDIKIIIKHILPNVLGAIIVISASNFASAILIESGLSFLGIGTQPPVPSWGAMVKDHYNYIILGKPFLAIIPGLAIMFLVMAFMILGNRLRDIFDVKN